MDIIERIESFNFNIGNTIDRPDERQVSLYVGLVLEEVAELVQAASGMLEMDDVKSIKELADRFKKGHQALADTEPDLDEDERVDILDAACDVVITAVGVGISLGANVRGALHEVMRANEKKLEHGRIDENGKLLKPDNWQAPDLRDYLYDDYEAEDA